MTKDEFIDAYVERSRPGHPGIERTPDGCRVGVRERVALPCRCGEGVCDGWAMIRDDPEDIAEHERRNAVEDEPTAPDPRSATG